jgi:hypothetical protein
MKMPLGQKLLEQMSGREDSQFILKSNRTVFGNKRQKLQTLFSCNFHPFVISYSVFPSLGIAVTNALAYYT